MEKCVTSSASFDLLFRMEASDCIPLKEGLGKDLKNKLFILYLIAGTFP